MQQQCGADYMHSYANCTDMMERCTCLKTIMSYILYLYRHRHTHRYTDGSMMIKLIGETAAFQIEVGRWQGVERKERMRKECQSEKVEDVCHWLLHLRRPLVEEVSQCDGLQVESLTKQAAFVLATACTDHALLNYLSSMWCARFGVYEIHSYLYDLC